MNNSNQTTEAIRNFFNDTEWEAIERSLADYQDYGERAEKLLTLFEIKFITFHIHLENNKRRAI